MRVTAVSRGLTLCGSGRASDARRHARAPHPRRVRGQLGQARAYQTSPGAATAAKWPDDGATRSMRRSHSPDEPRVPGSRRMPSISQTERQCSQGGRSWSRSARATRPIQAPTYSNCSTLRFFHTTPTVLFPGCAVFVRSRVLTAVARLFLALRRAGRSRATRPYTLSMPDKAAFCQALRLNRPLSPVIYRLVPHPTAYRTFGAPPAALPFPLRYTTHRGARYH